MAKKRHAMVTVGITYLGNFEADVADVAEARAKAAKAVLRDKKNLDAALDSKGSTICYEETPELMTEVKIHNVSLDWGGPTEEIDNDAYHVYDDGRVYRAGGGEVGGKGRRRRTARGAARPARGGSRPAGRTGGGLAGAVLKLTR